ncbi:MAG: tetratricopeptide repeat protein, partial [Chloroflexota bacterium]|nr:tetratricopeptide repeat protein [Chloroflexota bacterium]
MPTAPGTASVDGPRPAVEPPRRRLGRCPSALPVPLTRLVGRDREAAEAAALLRRPGVRLVTLTGPGGVGKTRLAIRVAAEMEPEFANGAAFVPLASVVDPGLVLPTVARALGVPESSGTPVLDRLAAALAEKERLLVLDNLEQVLSVAPTLAALLAACPGLRLLVTSRALLRISGEHDLSVPPLAVPDLRGAAPPPASELTDFDAVRLFVERARAVDPHLDPAGENAVAIAAVCRRLDGLPLAIELAAARVNLLPPPAMLARLERRLPLLTGGPRDLPARLRTMRHAIAWSHDLLAPEERVLFRRLAVFAGGFDLAAAERIGAAFPGSAEGMEGAGCWGGVGRTGRELPVLDGVGALIDQSLLRRVATGGEGGDPRFAMLETVREFALECLAASGEEADVRGAHAAFYLDLAEEAHAGTKGPDEGTWLDRLEAEHDNLRAAFDWALDAAPATALRLGRLLARFWAFRGYAQEGFDRLERALGRSDDGDLSQDRAGAANEAGALAEGLGRFDCAEALYGEALRVWHGLEDHGGAAKALGYLAYLAQLRGEPARAVELHTEAIASARIGGNARVAAVEQVNLAGALVALGDLAAGEALLNETLAYWRANDQTYHVSVVLNNLGTIALQRGEPDRAIAYHEESLRLKRELGHEPGIAQTLVGLGRALVAAGQVERGTALIADAVERHLTLADPRAAAVAQLHLGGAKELGGDDERAGALLAEAAATLHRLGDRASLADALEAIARRSLRRGGTSTGVRLAGAAAAIRQDTGSCREAQD